MVPCVALIPARFGSTRLPGKPLLRETGKYLIQHVYEQVARARRVDRVIVATDDDRIVSAVQGFGGEALLTSGDHPSGTDRVAEVVAGLAAEIIINVQGDEPDIDALAKTLAENGDVEMATAAVPIRSASDFASPDVVKAVVDARSNALFFSRSPIPHGSDVSSAVKPLKHIGVYAYQREALLKLARLEPVPLERIERLEQLRALHHGMTIRVIVTERDHLGIDTRAEYEAFVKGYSVP